MNISDIPPTRSVSLEGSDFFIDTDVPVGDFYSAISEFGVDYQNTVKEIQPRIDILDALDSPEVQDVIS